MLAANPSDVRKNLKLFMDTVVDNHETLIIARPEGREVVMLPKAEYDNMIENIHILGSKSNREWLLLGKKQAEAGELRQVDLE
jgi:antitoxin YefM